MSYTTRTRGFTRSIRPKFAIKNSIGRYSLVPRLQANSPNSHPMSCSHVRMADKPSNECLVNYGQSIPSFLEASTVIMTRWLRQQRLIFIRVVIIINQQRAVPARGEIGLQAAVRCRVKVAWCFVSQSRAQSVRR